MSEEAVIVGAELAAGHDGEAELVLRIRYPNGAVGDALLDATTGYALMRSCETDTLDGLIGQSWRKILEGV
ncbi:MAG: hypothetical protein KA105_06630 [Caulobacter sp.]|jgi:hypothetical protein|nr:hypothetical protein [Caulobacter sp.]